MSKKDFYWIHIVMEVTFGAYINLKVQQNLTDNMLA